MKFFQRRPHTLQIGFKILTNCLKAHGPCGGYQIMISKEKNYKIIKLNKPIKVNKRKNDSI